MPTKFAYSFLKSSEVVRHEYACLRSMHHLQAKSSDAQFPGAKGNQMATWSYKHHLGLASFRSEWLGARLMSL